MNDAKEIAEDILAIMDRTSPGERAVATIPRGLTTETLQTRLFVRLGNILSPIGNYKYLLRYGKMTTPFRLILKKASVIIGHDASRPFVAAPALATAVANALIQAGAAPYAYRAGLVEPRRPRRLPIIPTETDAWTDRGRGDDTRGGRRGR